MLIDFTESFLANFEADFEVFSPFSFAAVVTLSVDSVKISLPSFGIAAMIETGILLPISFFNSFTILSLSPSVTLG
jgi:hypothetical protein